VRANNILGEIVHISWRHRWKFLSCNLSEIWSVKLKRCESSDDADRSGGGTRKLLAAPDLPWIELANWYYNRTQREVLFDLEFCFQFKLVTRERNTCIYSS
jgi:hypothetical protein